MVHGGVGQKILAGKDLDEHSRRKPASEDVGGLRGIEAKEREGEEGSYLWSAQPGVPGTELGRHRTDKGDHFCPWDPIATEHTVSPNSHRHPI